MIGEGPGAEEADTGIPFSGVTGRELDRELLEKGLLRAKLYITNATACRPPLGKTEAMMRRAVQCCRPLLYAQLKKLDPNIPTLAMGKWAFYALTNRDKGVMNARGFIRGPPFSTPWSLLEFAAVVARDAEIRANQKKRKAKKKCTKKTGLDRSS